VEKRHHRLSTDALPFIKGWIGRHREYVDLAYGTPPGTVID
jgi:hypothetical protein